MELVNTSVKSALEQLLSLHKNATSDMKFMESGFAIIQTLLNNIHIAQSNMFASLVGNVTKQYPIVTKPIDNMAIADDTNIDEYMTQFSNISISAQNKNVLTPSLNVINSEVTHENQQPIIKRGEGPIDRWLREMRQEDTKHDIDNFEKEHTVGITDKYNIFNDDEPDPYNPEDPCIPCTWHNKINMDVEQCCARIGKQLFMIDHMEPEFLDNYPSDTYIDENGCVHGRSCLRTIDTELFNMGQIFCNDHAYDYEDIRKQPPCASPDIDFMYRSH
jgi:hypothetical protein